MLLPPTSTMSITSLPPFPPSISSKISNFSLLPSNQQNPLQNFHPFTKLSLHFTLTKTPIHPCCSPSDCPPIDGEEREFEEGIIDILLESGVSKEEAVEIVAKAPNYRKMVRESVEEFDELSTWRNSWSKEKKSEMTEMPLLTMKEKVKWVAREKGDLGKIPYLESVGLSLSSSLHLSRTLSSHSLSSLIYKVKYVKGIFFSGSDDERLVGRHARRMMLYLSIAVDDDIQQTLSFFEKIEARRGGLDMLGCGDTSFRYLIESFPRLLQLSVESHMKPTVDLLEKTGVPKARVGNALLLFPPLLFLDAKKVCRPGSWIIEKVGLSDKEFGRMLFKYPWVLSAGIQNNYAEILTFLEAKRVPKVSIDRAIKDWPLLLGCSTVKLKPMMELFDDLGVRTTKLGQAIGTSPQLLLRRPEEFLKVFSFFQSKGFDNDSICKILVRCPEIFAVRSEKTLQNKLEFLTGLGVPRQQQLRVVKKYPELLVSDVDGTIMPRLRFLRKCGLSERSVASMVVRFPPLLGYSIEEVLKPKLDFLVNTMGRPVKEVVDYPRYFSYSLETKIKPRFSLLRNQHINCSLKDMLGKNNEQFAGEYLGVEEMHVSFR